MKGILAEEYGVTPDKCRWIMGGTNVPVPAFGWIPQPVPDGVDVRHAPDGATLAAMLESGEIDALLSADVPQALLTGATTNDPAPVPRLPAGRARLLPAHRRLPDDARRRGPPRGRRRASVGRARDS